MKSLLWAIPVVFCVFSNAPAKTVDRIVAQVNEDIITLSDLNKEVAEYRKDLESKYTGQQLEQLMQKAEQQALDNLINEKLMYQKGVELGFNSDVDSKVSSEIQRMVKELNFKDTDELEKYFDQEGRSLKQYRDEVKKQIIIHDLIYAFVDSRITVLTPEVEKYYKEHQAEYSSPEEVALSEILITGDGNSAEAEARANDIYARLQKGESFTDLATQYSKGSTANKGGSIGTYLLSKLNADTVKAIAGLKDGDVSKPQKIKEGVIIYRVDTRKVSAVFPLEQVRSDIRNRIAGGKRGPELERFVNQLKQEAYINILPEMK
ncbi:MAG TPA: peptidyl-prolyl cis-trans isomerase [Acidobacteriota bacterium]|nr:peptidyl-prolyl cis-trans isomerase [Acidobacteriota bacterium]